MASEITIFSFMMFVIGGIHNVDSECTYLYAGPHTEYLESHSGYGSTSYPSNYFRCWVIEANSSTQIIELEEDHFSTEWDDMLKIYDGQSSTGDHRKTLSGSYNDFEQLYSKGRNLYLEFETDSFIQYDGFRFEYRSVHESEYCEYYGCSLSGWAIFGIVIGCLTVLVLIVASIYAISRSKSRSGRFNAVPPRQHVNTVTQFNAAQTGMTDTIRQPYYARTGATISPYQGPQGTTYVASGYNDYSGAGQSVERNTAVGPYSGGGTVQSKVNPS